MAVKDYMNAVSRYRGQIMGFAIVCILFFHSRILIAEPWNYFLNLLWGVDIFFFISGMGVHRSLSKNDDALAFYKRRFRRIYPGYLPVALLFFAPVLVRAVNSGETLKAVRELMGNVLMLGWVNGMGNQLNWYPQAVCLFYLAAPALFAAVKSFNGSGKKLALFFGFFLVTQVCFFNAPLLIAYSRLLYFLMGLICEELASRGSKLRLNVPALLILFLVGNYLMYYGQRYPTDILWGYGLSWYPGLLIVPGALMLLPKLFAALERVRALKWISRAAAFLGEYTFEILIVQLLLLGWLSESGISIESNALWLLFIIVTVVISVGYGKLIRKIIK